MSSRIVEVSTMPHRVTIKVKTLPFADAKVEPEAKRLKLITKTPVADDGKTAVAEDGNATVADGPTDGSDPAAVAAKTDDEEWGAYYVNREWSVPSMDDASGTWLWTDDTFIHPFWAIRRLSAENMRSLQENRGTA